MTSKRISDLFLLGVALPLALPLLLLLALLVRLGLGSPVLFWQERPGLHGRVFRLAKFRTMRELKPGEDMLSSDSSRMTPLGRVLRKTGLDELPSLYNIWRGELSWVGPRPLLVQYLPLYNEREALRHTVLPGLTGWAQVHGRNALDWKSRLELDAWYAQNRSLGLDMRILGRTVWLLLSGRGATSAGQATSEPFRGHP